MKQRLHWALTITALTIAVFGVTPLGSATVKTGLSAGKALHTTGDPARGPRGPRGLPGKRGPQGKKGPQGPLGAAVVARARSVGAITTPGDDPLTGNTWVQGAGEDDLIVGTITYESPRQCTGQASLYVGVYLDGSPIGSFLVFNLLTPGATALFGSELYVFAPGADTPRTLTAKVSSGCQERFTITSLKLDVAAID
jgi:hypothetical protein